MKETGIHSCKGDDGVKCTVINVHDFMKKKVESIALDNISLSIYHVADQVLQETIEKYKGDHFSFYFFDLIKL